MPIDDENCWAWSINYHPRRALTEAEVAAMKKRQRDPRAVTFPGTFIPLQNKRNDYLMDRDGTEGRHHVTRGVEGIAMQDASLQESMGPIQDRTRENLCPTDRGIVMARRTLLEAAQANRAGKSLPGARSPPSSACAPARSSCRATSTSRTHARHGLFAPPDTDPVTV